MGHQIYDVNQDVRSPIRLPLVRWSPPPIGCNKGNFDAAIFDGLDCVGVGVVPNSKSFVRPHVCHHCGVSGHTHPNCFKLFPHKRVSNRSHPLSKGSVPILGKLLKALSFLTQFQGNSNSSMSFNSHTRTRVFSSSRPKTRAVWVIKDPKT